MKRSLLVTILCLCSTAIMAQAWEYVNLRQYRAKDNDLVQAFVKHAYPFFNKSKRVTAVNRISATGESGRIYAATYFATYDQFSTFLKERGNDWDEYSKTPGNFAQAQADNVEGATDDVLWKLEKDQSNIPAGFDPSKVAWRKLLFLTVKSGMMPEYLATYKKVIEAEKKAGINYPFYLFTVAYGAPSTTVLVSLPAANPLEYYTALAARQKLREANPEITAMRKKLGAMTSNTLIDQITMIPY